MLLEQVIEQLETLAPPHLAEDWDAVGLHVGDPQRDIQRGLLCIDLTAAVLDEAIKQQASLIVAYHPPIFRPLERLTTRDDKQALILRAAEHRIAIYSPHTALDAAVGGVNDWLCQGIGQGDVHPITPTLTSQAAREFKLVTFVPAEHADKLRNALAGAGAGRIGDYTHCSFNLSGQGTFLGGESTHPTVGKRGKLEQVDEIRMEMVCPADRLTAAVAALREVHPYEEPAFDVVALEAAPSAETQTGQGRVLELSKGISLHQLVQRVKRHLKVKILEVAAPGSLRRVKRIGLCAGAGGSLLPAAGSVDAFVTGEMRHHDVLAAQTRGTAILLAGHTQTERPYLPVLRSRLEAATGQQVDWIVSRRDRPPSQWR